MRVANALKTAGTEALSNCELGAPIALIGGASVSDGVFLTGMIAVLLA